MKIKDNNGFAHFMLLAFAVLAVGVFGTYQAVSRTAQVSNKTLSASAHLKKCPTPRPLLSKGSTGDCVYYVQQKLGVRPVDGIFGEGTQTAVEKYQDKKGLASDGIIGGCSWAQLTTGRTTASCKTGKVVANSGVRPKATNDPTTTAKPTPRAADGQQLYCSYRDGDNVYVNKQPMTKAQCQVVKGRISTTPAKPKPVKVTKEPTTTAKPSPRAADGKQAYCTYRDGDNKMVFKQPMTLGQCKALKGRSSTTPPKATPAKVSCNYTTIAAKTETTLVKDAKACNTHRKSNHFGFCTRLTQSASKAETKQLCDSHKTGGAGTGTWREF